MVLEGPPGRRARRARGLAGPLLIVASCAAGTEPTPREVPEGPEPAALTAVAIHGRTGTFDVTIEGDRIAAITESEGAPKQWLVPAFVDAHVHLAYDREVVHGLAPDDHARDEALLDGGLAAVVDLAAPMRTLARDSGALRVVASGPMLTAVDGYPTNGWGHDGYGMFVRRAEDAAASVDRLHAAGARIVKLPFQGRPYLDEASFEAIVARAHERGMSVFAHALTDVEARYAGVLGVDVLAHTPVEPLDDATIELWKDRAVVSTLIAFGGSPSAIDNLRRLRAAGATVLYGTDLGNARASGIDARELELLARAGLDFDAIVAAGTSAPAERFEALSDLGRIEPGKRATFLVFDRDPSDDPTRLARPDAVWVDGRKR